MIREEMPVYRYTAPLTGRGFVRFVNIRPEQKTPIMEICDECGERVIPSKQVKHAKEHR